MGRRRAVEISTIVLLAAAAALFVAATLLWPGANQPAAAGPPPASLPVSQPADPIGAPLASDSSTVTGDPVQPTGSLALTSARLEDRRIDRAPQPVALRIDELSVDAPVFAAGGLVSTGEMEVPETIDEVAWYRFGPSPGEPGSAVLAAHVDLAGQGPGVFVGLRTLERGDRIAVDFADGSSQRFEVVDGAIYHKEDLDTDRIFARSGLPVLTLVTCGGAFNPSVGRYDSNVVVYAVPVSARAGAPR
jgi:hypothetical protein